MIVANPIPFEVPARDPHAELQVRLKSASTQHAEALLAVYDILQGLHDRGVLDVVRGGLGASDQIVEMVVDAAKTPEAIRGIRNLMVLARTMGTLEPKLLEGFFVAFHEALTTTKVQPQPPSLWHILNQFRSLQMRRGLMLVNSLLEALGRNLPVEKNS
jgi:uncharacterized protein YjgD (DUF1641 family)